MLLILSYYQKNDSRLINQCKRLLSAPNDDASPQHTHIRNPCTSTKISPCKQKIRPIQPRRAFPRTSRTSNIHSHILPHQSECRIDPPRSPRPTRASTQCHTVPDSRSSTPTQGKRRPIQPLQPCQMHNHPENQHSCIFQMTFRPHR